MSHRLIPVQPQPVHPLKSPATEMLQRIDRYEILDRIGAASRARFTAPRDTNLQIGTLGSLRQSVRLTQRLSYALAHEQGVVNSVIT